MIGSIIDKYEVLQKLGEGATATVYRGRHLTIGKDVAIKVLHPHLSASSRYRERFNREARAVGRLSHQNIVSILDYSGQGADDCYIVTELVDGVTLQQLLQQHGRLPSEIAAMVGADLASALGFAHREGIIHRDIKPENVMIRRDGRVKLMDFGVARVLDEGSITLDGSLLGSPAYMSPQQALDETLDGRSDLFSLGTVLFHAVTGHVPFSGSNASVILRNIIEANRPEVLELAPDASPSVAAVIDRLMQQRPEDRYPTADDVSDALRKCLGELRLSPEHPTINLRAYLVNPEGCTEALLSHLRPTLMEVGREHLASGDHLGALQLFNRLLAMDEENAEVIALIQSLHSGPDARRRPRWIAFGFAASLLAVGAGGWWWSMRHEVAPPKPAAHVEAPKAEVAAKIELPAPEPVTPAVAEAAPAPAPESAPPPVHEPAPAPPSRDPVRVGTRAASASADVATSPPAAALPGRLVIMVNTIGDVYVDGAKVGTRAGLKREEWVGTPTRPILLTPGDHQIQMKNEGGESPVYTVSVMAGEVKELDVELQRYPVKVLVNPSLPAACTTTVFTSGRTFNYDAQRNIELKDPSASDTFTFACPGGTFTATLGKFTPGQATVVPTEVPKLP